MSAACGDESLTGRQREIAERFVEVETLLLRMAEVVAPTHPRQAAILKRVHRESRDRLVAMRLGSTAASLQSRQLADALVQQQQLVDDLDALLTLLASDDRPERRLRQIHEEEVLEQLKWLAARFQTMLRLETSLVSEVAALAQSNAVERTRRIDLVRLARDQSKVISEANATLLILREDGTAQAITESLRQTAVDMIEVREQLEQGNTTVTGELLTTVIDALTEMLSATEESRREREKSEKSSGGTESESSPSSNAAQVAERQRLVTMISELKMVASMQRRVLDRTKHYEEMRQTTSSNEAVLAAQLDELARQQATIVRILETIRAGKHL